MENSITINILMDGTSWCAVYGDFIDLQESPAGFGDTQLEAIEMLFNEEIRQITCLIK